MFELDKLIREGLNAENFERTRLYVTKNVNLLTKTKSAELGYAIDSEFYGIPEYNTYLKQSLAKLTVEDVNRAIRKHLRSTDLQVVVVAKDCAALKAKFLSNEVSPMTYNSPKPAEVMEEDKIIERWRLDWKPEDVRVVPVDGVFE